MRDYIKVIIAIIAVFVVHTFFGKISKEIPIVLNLFTIIVIYFAILKGEVFGAFTGAICGLIQDSFSFGVFGVAGLATTLTGYLAGTISKKIYVISFFKNFLFILILSIFQLVIWRCMHSFVFSEPFFSESVVVLFQPFFNALVGSVFFPVFRKIFKYTSLDGQ
jgi:rod shape-determining protein MreD